ncbi:MAG: hypothetical protein VYD57_13445 [Pseudomonadota bacterium]|nr:hypothetical protein [Pseudomonadota bacterium]
MTSKIVIVSPCLCTGWLDEMIARWATKPTPAARRAYLKNRAKLYQDRLRRMGATEATIEKATDRLREGVREAMRRRRTRLANGADRSPNVSAEIIPTDFGKRERVRKRRRLERQAATHAAPPYANPDLGMPRDGPREQSKREEVKDDRAQAPSA